VSKRFILSRPGKKKTNYSEMWTATGTHFYCAPEIYEGGGYNYKIDIWAIGVNISFLSVFIRLSCFNV